MGGWTTDRLIEREDRPRRRAPMPKFVAQYSEGRNPPASIGRRVLCNLGLVSGRIAEVLLQGASRRRRCDSRHWLRLAVGCSEARRRPWRRLQPFFLWLAKRSRRSASTSSNVRRRRREPDGAEKDRLMATGGVCRKRRLGGDAYSKAADSGVPQACAALGSTV